MAFHQHLRVPTVIDLKTSEKETALREMAQTLCRALDIKKQKPIIDEMLHREVSASTFVGQGVAIPQAKASIKTDFAIAIGRSINGIDYDAVRNSRAHVIVLVFAKDPENAKFIELLGELATFFKDPEVMNHLVTAQPPIDAMALLSSFSPAITNEEKPSAPTGKKGKTPGDPVVSHAVTITREVKAKLLLVFADTVRDEDFLDQIRLRGKTIIVTSNKTRFSLEDKRVAGIIQAPPFPASRTGQIKMGVLLALSRGFIDKSDKVVCLSGNSKIGVFDTIVIFDVSSEYEFFFTTPQQRSILPPDVKPEVLERVIGLAGEIAVEGREGKPTGTIFVVGDTNSVNAYIRQLIINPFRGYSEAERNILDPGLGETIKEFAGIDGSFVITGDGVILSAGSYLKPASNIDTLPSGFGARHAAAAGISACTNALAIAISESTGMVSMFKNGSIVLTISKPILRDKQTVQNVI